MLFGRNDDDDDSNATEKKNHPAFLLLLLLLPSSSSKTTPDKDRERSGLLASCVDSVFDTKVIMMKTLNPKPNDGDADADAFVRDLWRRCFWREERS